MLLEHRHQDEPRSWFSLGRVALVAVIALAGFFVVGLFNVTVKPPCSDAIGYRIGSIDPQFGIGESDLRKAIASANGIWSQKVGHDLFRYDPDARLAINLVYDWRQRASQNEVTAEGAIDQLNVQADALKSRFVPMKRDLEAGKVRYEAQLDRFNNEVHTWNALGGATEEVRADFHRRADALDQERAALNGENNRINQLIFRYNALIAQINGKAAAINGDGLAGREYLKGVHVRDGNGEHIDIFEYKHQADLILVLAHEMGHALGLVHNGNPNSIMSPVLKSATDTPSADDLAELKQVCHLK